MSLDTFDEVVKKYDGIKPLVSSNHSRDNDVRPIGSRKHKYERIKKINNNTYALLDGGYGSTYKKNYPPQGDMEHYENIMAPITWAREEDGDYITIRNHAGNNNYSYPRYEFIYFHIPRCMRFVREHGGGRVETGGKTFALPKCGVVFNHQTNIIKHMDNVALRFRANEDGTFTRAGDLFTAVTKHIDKALKKEWKGRIDAFYIYIAAIAPIVDTSWEALSEYSKVVMQWCEDNPRGSRLTRLGHRFLIPVELMRQVVTQEDHPVRIAVVAAIVQDIGAKRRIDDDKDIKSIRSSYVRVINKLLALHQTEEV